jgi:hypothetical protein
MVPIVFFSSLSFLSLLLGGLLYLFGGLFFSLVSLVFDVHMQRRQDLGDISMPTTRKQRLCLAIAHEPAVHPHFNPKRGNVALPVADLAVQDAASEVTQWHMLTANKVVGDLTVDRQISHISAVAHSARGQVNPVFEHP